MEIDSGAIWTVTQADPVVRDGIPLVFYYSSISFQVKGGLRLTREHGGKDGEDKDREYREPASVVAHPYNLQDVSGH